MNRLEDTSYEVYRSRNNGEFWSNLTAAGTYWRFEDAQRKVDLEHRDHPSDWLRVVKVESRPIYGFDGRKDWIAE